MIKTIKDLKEAIKDLPDDMTVSGYAGSGRENCIVSHFILDSDECDDLDSDEFVISVDN